MDISEDLCRADFFDLAPMGLDPKFGDPTSHSLMPVTLIDSADYLQPDGNNNLGGSTGPIKSFLDEMLLVDPMTGDASGQDISPLGGHSLEVLGTLHWNSDGTPGAITAASGATLDCEDNANSWFLNSNFNADGEVTTLTNLVDPLFVTYGDSRNVGTGDSCDSIMMMDHDGAVTTTIKIEPQDSSQVVSSSDLISSTYNISDSSTSTNPTTTSDSIVSQSTMSWMKRELEAGLNTTTVAATAAPSNFLCDESLLRTALQSGKSSHTTTKIVKLAVVASSVPVQGAADMTELRTLLSFPPLTSPSSSTVDINGNGGGQLNSGPLPAYYELKVIDPMFSGEEANIPNVEELIMTRIDPPFGGYQASVANNNNNNTINNNNNNNDSLIKKKLGEVAERKINSTTLSTKWTYTTNANGQQAKAPRKRKKNNNNNNNNINNNNNNIADAKKGQNGDNPASPGSTKTIGSPAGSQASLANGVRKERSLHYCNICCKGFKDKYSVNVHVRTHTGEKPFSCTLCGKNFRQKAHLAKHYQTHAAKAANEQLKAANNNNNNANSNSNSNCSTSNNATVSSTNGSLDETSSTSCSNNSNVDIVDSSQR